MEDLDKGEVMSEINELAKALNEFQAEIVTVGKKAENPFFKSKYADLGSIMKEAQPVLTKHGLSITQLPDNIDGKPALRTTVMHSSGQSISATVPLVLSKEDPQGFGSAMTYFRRYGYAAALQIVIDEDDDGNSASRPTTSQSAPKQLTGMATDKQREIIARHLKSIGVEEEDQKGYLIEQFGVDLPLSKQVASEIIDALFAKEPEKG